MKQVFIALAACLLFMQACKKDSSLTPSAVQPLAAKIFVANENGSTVQVIDANNTDNSTTVNLDDHTGDMLMPHNVQVAPDGKTVWVTIHPMIFGALDQVAVIDLQSLAIKKRIYVGHSFHLAHVVLDDHSTNAFVTATDSDRVVMIETTNYTVVKAFMLPAGHAPHGMRYYKGKLYVACMDGKCLTIIDVASGQQTDVALGGVAVQTAITPDGKYVFVSLYDTKEVARYEIASGQVIKFELPAASQGPIQLYPCPDNKTILVCDQGKLDGRPSSNHVYMIDVSSMNVVADITVGNAAHGVVVSKDGKKAYVTNSDDNTLSVIDLATKTVEKIIPVGVDPNGVSYWYEGGGMP